MDTEKLRDKIAKIGCGKCCDWGGDASGCLGVEDECMWPAEVDSILQAFKDYLMEKAEEIRGEHQRLRKGFNSGCANKVIKIANSLTPDTVCPQCNRTWFSNSVPDVCHCGRRLR